MLTDETTVRSYLSSLLEENESSSVLRGASAIQLTPAKNTGLSTVRIYLNGDEIYYIDSPDDEQHLWERLDSLGLLNMKNKALIRGFRTQRAQLLRSVTTAKTKHDNVVTTMKDYVLGITDRIFLWENVTIDFLDGATIDGVDNLSLAGEKYTFEQMYRLALRRVKFRDEQYVRWGFRDDDQLAHGTVHVKAQQKASKKLKVSSTAEALAVAKDFSFHQMREELNLPYFNLILAVTELEKSDNLEVTVKNPHGFYRSQLRKYYQTIPTPLRGTVFGNLQDVSALEKTYNVEAVAVEQVKLETADDTIDPDILTSFEELIQENDDADEVEAVKKLEKTGKRGDAPTINYEILPDDEIPEEVLQEENINLHAGLIAPRRPEHRHETAPKNDSRPPRDTNSVTKDTPTTPPPSQSTSPTSEAHTLRSDSMNATEPQGSDSLLAFSLPDLIAKARKELQDLRDKVEKRATIQAEKEASVKKLSSEVTTAREQLELVDEKVRKLQDELNSLSASREKCFTAWQDAERAHKEGERELASIQTDGEVERAKYQKAQSILDNLSSNPSSKDNS